MILFHNATCQRQSKSPATLFRRETRGKNIFNVFLTNTFTVVGHLNHNTIGSFQERQVNASGALHGVNSIFTKILNNPLE